MARQIVVQFVVAGPFAWLYSETGQVGNEAAIAVSSQCRSKARHFCFGQCPWRCVCAVMALFLCLFPVAAFSWPCWIRYT